MFDFSSRRFFSQKIFSFKILSRNLSMADYSYQILCSLSFILSLKFNHLDRTSNLYSFKWFYQYYLKLFCVFFFVYQCNITCGLELKIDFFDVSCISVELAFYSQPHILYISIDWVVLFVIFDFVFRLFLLIFNCCSFRFSPSLYSLR